jgi:transposase
MKGMINNWTGLQITRRDMKHLDSGDMEKIFSGIHETLSAQSLLEVIRVFNEEIKKIEKAVLQDVSLKEEFKQLLTVCGIGEILGITIMLETGDIGRFAEVGNYSSYCRCVSSKKLTNKKKKGSGNKKNGNKYLAWAFVEAAHYMQRFSPKAKNWYQSKASKRGPIVATKALSNKIARACYYIMKDRTAYNPKKMFG